MQTEWLSVVSIGVALLLGAMSPGQSFVLVAKTALSSSRRDGLATALGMGVGCAIFSVIALSGLHSILLTVPWLYKVLKVGGGIYLIYLAVQMFRGSHKSLQVDAAGSAEIGFRKGFGFGLLTQLCNPNTAIVLAGVFAALLSHHIPVYLYIVLPVLAFSIDTLWYAFVAYVLSSARPRSAYLHYKNTLDRVSGGVMALLGIKLILSK